MEREITLIKTRTFWLAFLGLLTEIAKGLNLPWLLGFANDPHSADMILNVVSGLAFMGAMWTRKAAKAKVVGIIKPADGDKTLYASPLALLVAAAVAAQPQACTQQDLQTALANIHSSLKSAEDVAAEAAPQVCSDIKSLEMTGEIVLTSGLLGASDVTHARTVEAGLDALCINPTAQNSAAILGRGIAAYAELATLFKKAAK